MKPVIKQLLDAILQMKVLLEQEKTTIESSSLHCISKTKG